MPDEVIVRSNLPDFKRDLENFGIDMAQKITGRAARAGITKLKDAVIAEAPRRTGRLRAAVYVKSNKKETTAGQWAYGIRIRSGKREQTRRANKQQREFKFKTVNLDAFYWYYLEKGWIPRGPGNPIGGGKRVRKIRRANLLSHGGANFKRFPFIKPAFQKTRDPALQEIIRLIDERIKRENRKIARRDRLVRVRG